MRGTVGCDNMHTQKCSATMARGIFQSLCILLLLLSCCALSAENGQPRVRNIVLVHGAWADADLRAEIEELLVVKDRAVVRYIFTGHFTGTFKDVKGDGREISFRAVDIYRVQNGQISDNWHLEDNLSLMQQLGVVKP
jgi:hypothetical protein